MMKKVKCYYCDEYLADFKGRDKTTGDQILSSDFIQIRNDWVIEPAGKIQNCPKCHHEFGTFFFGDIIKAKGII